MTETEKKTHTPVFHALVGGDDKTTVKQRHTGQVLREWKLGGYRHQKRPTLNPVGCPKWFDVLVVGEKSEDAQKLATILGIAAVKERGVVAFGSSYQSRNVHIKVADSEARLQEIIHAEYAIVPYWHLNESKTETIADEIWISDQPFSFNAEEIAATKKTSEACRLESPD